MRAMDRLLRRREQQSEFFDLPDDFWALHASCHKDSMTNVERLYGLYEAVRYVARRSIAGDIVECGVWRGGSMMLAAHTLQREDDTARRLWLYDTFAGMSEPTDADVQATTGVPARRRWKPSATGNTEWCYASEQTVRENMLSTGYPGERIKIVTGQVEETIPARAPERIALLRLDTDWYESTRHELQHLWPRVEPGGVLIIDDYGWWQGARRAVDEYFSARPVLLSRLDFTGRMAVKT
jgi:O-methyltransferase